MQSSLVSVFDQHEAIEYVEYATDGAVVVNGYRKEELIRPCLTNWQHKADAVFAAAQRDLEALGIFCEGFALWRDGVR